MSENIEEAEFAELLNDKRHKEIIEVLKNILVNLSDNSKNESIGKLMSFILSKVNDDKIPKSISVISQVISEKLDKIITGQNNKSDDEWIFIINRDEEGYIDTVRASTKIKKEENTVSNKVKNN